MMMNLDGHDGDGHDGDGHDDGDDVHDDYYDDHCLLVLPGSVAISITIVEVKNCFQSSVSIFMVIVFFKY